jgi:hypothetical protein
LTSAKRVAGLSLVGTLILLSAGGILVARGSDAYGWWLVALGLANTAVPATMLTRQRRQVQSATAERTGDSQALAQHKNQVAGMFGGRVRDAAARRLSGVAYMPSKMGYVHASAVILLLEHQSLGSTGRSGSGRL